MAAGAVEHVPGAGENKDRSVTQPGSACGQCGRINEPDCVFCQTCGGLLPEPDPNPVLTYGSGADDRRARRAGSRRVWFRVVLSTVLLLALVSVAAIAILRATEPEPEEKLADESSHRALALLKSLSKARTLDQVRGISPAGSVALAPIVEMLPRLSSDNDTRPRLDAYRSLFRGVASLEYLQSSRLEEWGKARQLIDSSLRQLTVNDPMTGMLTSQGRVAMDAVQDEIDAIQRARAVREGLRSVGLQQIVRSLPHSRSEINNNSQIIPSQFGESGIVPSHVPMSMSTWAQSTGESDRGEPKPATCFTFTRQDAEGTGHATDDDDDDENLTRSTRAINAPPRCSPVHFPWHAQTRRQRDQGHSHT